MEIKNGIITAGVFRTMIAELDDNEPLLIMKECDGIGYNATAIEFSSAHEEDFSLGTLWIID